MRPAADASAWLVRHIARPPDTDDCVPWPFGGTHNGHAVCAGTTVARILLRLVPGDGLVARHICHNATCVNIRHLIPGTAADNSQDMVRAGRSLAGARNPQYGKRVRRGLRPTDRRAS